MYKTETHLHTKEVSRCGKLYADEMVSMYKDAGYDTLFITDHLSESFFERQEEGMSKQNNKDTKWHAV